MQSSFDVVVVGAGLAGLRCAHDLAVSGAQVLVLEARDRVGGRVWSHRFSDGQVCERGAEFIDANHVEVIALAARLGVDLSVRSAIVDPSATLIDAGGRAVPLGLHASLVEDLERYERALIELDADTADESTTLADLVGSLGLSAVSRVVVGRDVRTEFMLPPDEVSTRFAAQVASRQQPGGREVHRVVGGNDLLASGLARLATAAGAQLALRTIVRSVDEATGEVHVVSADAAMPDRLVAATVVAAVPVPVLTRVWPATPAEIGALGYGIGGKISIQFSRRLWRDLGRNGAVRSDRQWGELWETTDDQPGDAGVLTGLLASHDGAALAAMPEAPSMLLAEIDRIFPGVRALAGERVHTDWTNDPLSLGCYTCAGPGQWSTAWPLLRERFDRVLLAGEHTDEFTGYMEGALRSGARTAQRILSGA